MKISSAYRHIAGDRIRPTGWLHRQLRIQADGLSGNLDKMWPDIRNSAWIGGNCDGWERVPYWLDGFIPLAYLLDDDDLKARAEKYINAIIDRQESDGWICPCRPEDRARYDAWAILLICKVLLLYYEYTNDARALNAATAALRNLRTHLNAATLFNWGQSRWFEALIPIRAIYERTPEPWLHELAIMLATQGLDYKRLFEGGITPVPRHEWNQHTHIVNLMMALKSEALYTAITNDDPNAFATMMFDMLQKYHGSPLGFINGDECLAGKEAINGTELCSIAEAMYSFEVLFEMTGDPVWMERADEYAFNFLPATISSDMWTHQYLQLTNQIACCVQDTPPVFYTNGPDCNCFGLEPGYGCCTANFNQAWPKFAGAAFFENDEGVLCATPVPAILHTVQNGVGVCIETSGEYPFSDRITFRIQTEKPTRFVFALRIPACSSATLDGCKVTPGSIVRLERIWSEKLLVLELEQVPEWKQSVHGLMALKRGPLYFAAPIAETREMLEYEKNGVVRKFPYCDYTILPNEEWGLAFAGKDCLGAFEHRDIDAYPFSEINPPICVEAELAVIDWGLQEGQHYVCRTEPRDRTPIRYIRKMLVPYGATTLRMTALPMVAGADQ